MKDLKNMTTSLLESMIKAHSAHYREVMTEKESTACAIITAILQTELESRKQTDYFNILSRK